VAAAGALGDRLEEEVVAAAQAEARADVVAASAAKSMG
jgi:hypothetical protein